MSKKHGSTHHLAPRSKGGPDVDWNKKDEKTKRHQGWHALFRNWLPCQAVYVTISRWAARSGYLNRKKLSKKMLKAVDRLFGGNILPKGIVKNIKEEWVIKDQPTFRGCFGYKECFEHNNPGNPGKICPIIEMYKRGEIK